MNYFHRKALLVHLEQRELVEFVEEMDEFDEFDSPAESYRSALASPETITSSPHGRPNPQYL
jgi:hypothetical protein